MVGGIIPLRRATSSRYDGRLEQESAISAGAIRRIRSERNRVIEFTRTALPVTRKPLNAKKSGNRQVTIAAPTGFLGPLKASP
jgi:hypothetical protein